MQGLVRIRLLLLAGLTTLWGFTVGSSVTAAPAAHQTPTTVPTDAISSMSGYFQADERRNIDAVEGVLPDLQNLPPADLRLVYSLGKKYLRFSVSIWNAGPGVLELIGQPNRREEEIEVNQRIFDEEGSEVGELPVGVFVYHPFHLHTHLGEFAHYEIWSVRDDFTPDVVVADGGKVSYCVRDISRIDRDEQGERYPLRSAYNTCNAEIQGLTPGWIDVYAYYLPGQSIEISHLPNGVYALTSTANPEGNVHEADHHNNMGVTYFTLYDLAISVLSGRITEGLIQK